MVLGVWWHPGYIIFPGGGNNLYFCFVLISLQIFALRIDMVRVCVDLGKSLPSRILSSTLLLICFNWWQLLHGLKNIHSANICYRDLKPENLLVNANCELKICNFGLTRTGSGKVQFMTEYIVTCWYRSPELLLCCDNYDTSIDV